MEEVILKNLNPVPKDKKLPAFRLWVATARENRT